MPIVLVQFVKHKQSGHRYSNMYSLSKGCCGSTIDSTIPTSTAVPMSALAGLQDLTVHSRQQNSKVANTVQ